MRNFSLFLFLPSLRASSQLCSLPALGHLLCILIGRTKDFLSKAPLHFKTCRNEWSRDLLQQGLLQLP